MWIIKSVRKRYIRVLYSYRGIFFYYAPRVNITPQIQSANRRNRVRRNHKTPLPSPIPAPPRPHPHHRHPASTHSLTPGQALPLPIVTVEDGLVLLVDVLRLDVMAAVAKTWRCCPAYLATQVGPGYADRTPECEYIGEGE